MLHESNKKLVFIIHCTLVTYIKYEYGRAYCKLFTSISKLFTSIINNRLSTFAENSKIITNSQAGFRKDFSTLGNIFIINCLIDIFKSQKKKLYCTFVDFKQAFDRVWRDGLSAKLHSYKINGKCLNIIKNIYEQSKSRITTAEGSSAFFPCNS